MSSEDLSSSVGRCIRHLREEIGWSQEELASRSGLHRTYVGAIERGERNITLNTLGCVATALGVPPAEILAQTDDDRASQKSRGRK